MWKNDSGHGVHSKAHCLQCEYWWVYGRAKTEVLLPFDERPEEQEARHGESRPAA